MELDDDLCICFHVSRRKVLNFLRVEQPQRCGQLAECFGAGTGCGWCRPFLRKLFDEAMDQGHIRAELPTLEQYRALRAKYLQDKDVGRPIEGPSLEERDESPTGD